MSHESEPTIPKSRFDDRVKQAHDTEAALREQIAQLTDANKALTRQAGKAEALTAQVTDLTAQLETAGQSPSRQMAATRAGITDPEDVADALAIYQRRSPEGVTFEDWLSHDSLPRVVRSMLPQPAADTPTPIDTTAAAPQAIEQAPRSLPRSNAGVVPPTSARAAPTMADLQAAARDPDQYRQMRERLGLSATNPHANRLRLGRRR